MSRKFDMNTQNTGYALAMAREARNDWYGSILSKFYNKVDDQMQGYANPLTMRGLHVG